MTYFDPYDSLVPVFLETEIPRRIRQVGTAIFRELWGEPFLITAAHVTDELRNGVLLVPTVQGLSPIDGYMAHIDLPPEVSRLEDDVDIAYYRLSTEFAAQLSYHFKPLPQGGGEVIRSALELTVCSASGYPASKGKKNGETTLLKSSRFVALQRARKRMTASVCLLSNPSSFISTRNGQCILEPRMHFPRPASRAPVAGEYSLGLLVLNYPMTGHFHVSSGLFIRSKKKRG
jgi:hypothetical protein